MSQSALDFLLSLTSTLVLPAPIWVLTAWRVSRLRGLHEQNYEEKVRETLEGEIIKKMSDKLDDLFPQYGLTPPSQSHLRNNWMTGGRNLVPRRYSLNFINSLGRFRPRIPLLAIT
jgi:hypothetical protein